MINDNPIYNVIYRMHPSTRHEMVYLPPSRAADTPPHSQDDRITTDSKKVEQNHTQRKTTDFITI